MFIASNKLKSSIIAILAMVLFVPAMDIKPAKAGVSFNIYIGNGPSYGYHGCRYRRNCYRPVKRRLMTYRHIKRMLRRQGFRHVRFLGYRGNRCIVVVRGRRGHSRLAVHRRTGFVIRL